MPSLTKSTAVAATCAELQSLAAILASADRRLAVRQRLLRKAAKSAPVIGRHPDPQSRENYTLEEWIAGAVGDLRTEISELAEHLADDGDEGRQRARILRFLHQEATAIAHRRAFADRVKRERRRRRLVLRAQALARSLWRADRRSKGGVAPNPLAWHWKAINKLQRRRFAARYFDDYMAQWGALSEMRAYDAPKLEAPGWWNTEKGEAYGDRFGSTGFLEWAPEVFRDYGKRWVEQAAEELEREERGQRLAAAA